MGLPMGFHHSAGFQMQGRPNNELMLLGLEEYTKLPSAGSSVSSPDSHNSDSSLEISDRHNLLRKLSDHHHSPTSNKSSHLTNSSGSNNNNKELFLPLPFSGLASLPMMPPPSFLPQSHLLFPGYHPALYSHHQGLLKPVDQHMVNNSLALHHHHQQQQLHQQQQQQLHQNNNSRFTPNHNHPAMFGTNLLSNNNNNNNSLSISNLNSKQQHHGSKTAEELTKRFYLDAVLKSQLSPRNGLSIKSQRSTEEEEDERYSETNVSDENLNGVGEIDRNNNKNMITKERERHTTEDEDEEVVDAMTPPRSPISNHNKVSPKTTTSSKSGSATKSSHASSQDNPIDLSMKTGSSTTSDENRSTCSVAGSDLDNEDGMSNDHSDSEQLRIMDKPQKLKLASPMMRNGSDPDEDAPTEYDREIKRMKFQGTTPLDLTTKV